MAFKKICFLALLTYGSSQVDALWYPKPKCESFVDTFSRNDVIEISKFNGNLNSGYEWVSEFVPNHAVVEDGELVLSMPLGTHKNAYGRLQGFGATVTSIRWMQYGNVTARVKTASTSPGVVTSFIIRNPEGDEIDFEWVGGSPDKVQTNYFYDGILDYKNSVQTSVGSNTAEGFNEYMFQWEEDFIKFYVNKKVIRTLYKKDTWDEKMKVYKYPARAAQVHVGLWDGGRGAPGTTEWAGGPTNWSNPKTVYKAYFDYIDIQCHYKDDKPKLWHTSTKVDAPTKTKTKSTASTTVVTSLSPSVTHPTSIVLVTHSTPSVASVIHSTPITSVTHFTPVTSVTHSIPIASVTHSTPITSATYLTPVTSVTHSIPIASVTHSTPITSATYLTPVASVTHSTPITSATYLTPVASVTHPTPSVASVTHSASIVSVKHLTTSIAPVTYSAPAAYPIYSVSTPSISSSTSTTATSSTSTSKSSATSLTMTSTLTDSYLVPSPLSIHKVVPNSTPRTKAHMNSATSVKFGSAFLGVLYFLTTYIIQ